MKAGRIWKANRASIETAEWNETAWRSQPQGRSGSDGKLEGGLLAWR
ncbi:MAG: hypothetical protein ABI680_13860 [Chthoniobacteraceae bacterium]